MAKSKVTDIVLTNEQLGYLRVLQRHEGFKLYIVLLQNRFDIEYKRLRKCNRDKTFEKINGFLDAIEYATSLVDNTILESHNPETDGQGEK